MARCIRFVLLLCSTLSICVSMYASEFDCTLRLDYIFSGTDRTAEISLAKMSCLDGWYGRRVNMDRLLLRGNGRIIMSDRESGRLLYVNSFSTLFQEWQHQEEATRVRRAFENVFLVPMPSAPAVVTVELADDCNRVIASLTHCVDPSDILISPLRSGHSFRYLLKSGPSEDCIDVAFVAEGYTAGEEELFFSEAETAMESILSHEPFKSMKDRFNFVAIAAQSQESGISVPHEHDWKNTVLGSSFDTFYSERYLTTPNLFRLHDVLASVPYEHIVILANTDTYGGGGIYNCYMLSSMRHPHSRTVIVHEFGHSFAGLADEYYYDDQYDQTYNNVVEPWEPNITTMVDFGSKWEDMLETDRIVTKEEQASRTEKSSGCSVSGFKVGLYEGAGYMSEGAYRPYPDCRMKTNQFPCFCPVCERAIRKMIDFNTVSLE